MREKIEGNCRVVKDFDKGEQTGGGAEEESVNSTVKRLRDKTRELERWREDVRRCRLQIKRKWDQECEVKTGWIEAAGGR